MWDFGTARIYIAWGCRTIDANLAGWRFFVVQSVLRK